MGQMKWKAPRCEGLFPCLTMFTARAVDRGCRYPLEPRGAPSNLFRFRGRCASLEKERSLKKGSAWTRAEFCEPGGPLEAAWLLMAVEGPFVAAVIARLADPTINLAAFGVAFSFGMFFESPIILIMSAATALVADRDSYAKLKRFTWSLNALITLALLVFVLPPIFGWVIRRLMGLPGPVADFGAWGLPPSAPVARRDRLSPVLPGHPHPQQAHQARRLRDHNPADQHERGRHSCWRFSPPGPEPGWVVPRCPREWSWKPPPAGSGLGNASRTSSAANPKARA